MKEEIVLFETAKLAAKKGFPQIVSEIDSSIYGMSWYNKKGVFCGRTDLGPNGKDYGFYPTKEQINSMVIGSYLAPTQSLLQKWLRDKHKIVIQVVSTLNRGWTIEVFSGIAPNKQMIEYVSSKIFPSYEKALETGLQEGLKLIKL